jgi:nicotinate-nucleotide pyrophosphorylase (carboxylating)
VEIEVQDFNTLSTVLENPPDVIMLDNFSDEELPIAIRQIKASSKNCCIEASGGMTLERVSKIAGFGMDYISVGQLTHSSPSLNMSMDLEKNE